MNAFTHEPVEKPFMRVTGSMNEDEKYPCGEPEAALVSGLDSACAEPKTDSCRTYCDLLATANSSRVAHALEMGTIYLMFI